MWGLTVDDIAVASFHGTSTNANDRNESQVVHRQFEHLGRSRGNPVYCIAQKWLTGHPKGPAAAWMFNGVTQAVLSGVVPGNRNIDNTAPELQKYTHIIYPNRSLDIASKQGGMKAGLLKSFGFGQAGAEILVIHPDYLLATLDDDAYTRYDAAQPPCVVFLRASLHCDLRPQSTPTNAAAVCISVFPRYIAGMLDCATLARLRPIGTNRE